MATIDIEPARQPPGPYVPIRDLDIVFISYDEPQADRHWADLLSQRPDAHRVHGVTGLDGAHKTAAASARTGYFVTIDGDTTVDPTFFDLVLDRRQLSSRRLITWPSRNNVNGLVYGNGSLKCWHRRAVLGMRTHEAAASKSTANVDFGRLFERIVAAGCYSETHINGSPEQIFRAGFREGVKLSLDNGKRAEPQLHGLSPAARRRLQVWCSIGADIEHGLLGMLGARLGCINVNLEGWDPRCINDYKRLNALWDETAATLVDNWSIHVRLRELGDRMRRQLGLPVAEITPEQSQFFKDTQFHEAEASAPPVAVAHAATSAKALDKLGTLHRRGQGVPLDPGEAARLYALADKFGSHNGTKNLALCYLRGIGVEQNATCAIALLRKATAAGSPDAPFHLAEVLRSARDLMPEPEEIVELLELAGSRGCAPALRTLGRLLEAGDDVSLDPNAAAVAYARASALGDDDAGRLLRRLRTRFGQETGGGGYPSAAATG